MRILLLLLILAAALGWLAWGRLLAAQGISELSWQGLDLSATGWPWTPCRRSATAPMAAT